MRKLLAIAIIFLFTFGMALPAMAGGIGFEKGQTWYQHKIDVLADNCKVELSAIRAARAEEAQLSAIGVESTPGAMAANATLDVYDLTIEAQFRANRLAEAALRF